MWQWSPPLWWGAPVSNREKSFSDLKSRPFLLRGSWLVRSYSDHLKSIQIGAFPRQICQNSDSERSICLQGRSLGSTLTFNHDVFHYFHQGWSTSSYYWRQEVRGCSGPFACRNLITQRVSVFSESLWWLNIQRVCAVVWAKMEMQSNFSLKDLST